MSVEFPSYPANTASAVKPVDLQTLQESFAAALRSYTTANSDSQTDTMLEVLQTSQEHHAEVQKQERHEYQQRNDSSTVDQLDRKLQNKSELRQGEMNTDYQHQRDRQETLRQDYQEKIEQRADQPLTDLDRRPQTADDSQTHAMEQDTSVNPPPATSPPVVGNERQIVESNQTQAVQQNALIDSHSAAPSAAFSAPVSHQPSAVLPSPPPVVPMNAFTIFTASKRFGQNQEQQDEKEDDDEKEGLPSEVPINKPQPFAVFEAIKKAAAREPATLPPKNTMEKEPITVLPQNRQTAPEREPKEIEPNRLSHVKTLDEFLNISPNVLVPDKTTEGKQQTAAEREPYFHRIAAACEAAAQYAPIRIKVHLGNLGTMTLRFYYQSEKLMLQFETPSEESAEFLQEHLDGLQTILTKRHIRLKSVEVLLIKERKTT